MIKALHSAYTLHRKTLTNTLFAYTLTQFKDSRVDCPLSKAAVVTCAGVWVVLVGGRLALHGLSFQGHLSSLKN